MSMPNLPSYPIPLDGAAHVITLPAPYVAHGLIVVNGGAVALNVTSSRGQHWTVGPGGRLEAPLPESVPIYTLQSVVADDTGGTASATFVTQLIAVESNTGIASTTLPDVLLVPRTDASALTTATASLTLTSGIQSVTIICQMSSYNLTPGTSRLVGDQSGIIYWEAPTNPSSVVLNSFSVPVYTGLDSSAALTLNWAAAQAGTIYMVVGHSYEAGASINPSGSLSVGLTAGEVPLPVTPPYYRAADYSAYEQVQNPANSQQLASIAGLPAGAYYIEWDIACESSPVAGGKHGAVYNATTNTHIATVVFPAGRGGAISGYYSSTVWTLAVQNGIAITDNSFLAAALRVWKI